MSAPQTSIQTMDDLTPIQVAEQLTLLEFKMFQQIRPKELFKIAWQGPNDERLAPHVLQVLSWTDQV